MNLLNYLGPATSELQLALKEAGYDDLEGYMKERTNSEMTVEERISYHLGQINLIADITQYLQKAMNKEEEEE
jgi:hypothetical protein|tara:strand:- start:636 stop:854 length:219 start_codon:yes stop_codon:yes gene_type:complete